MKYFERGTCFFETIFPFSCSIETRQRNEWSNKRQKIHLKNKLKCQKINRTIQLVSTGIIAPFEISNLGIFNKIFLLDCPFHLQINPIHCIFGLC